VIRPHIVIVDGEIRFRETMSKILEHEGFRVTSVGSGGKALEELRQTAADAVLLDVRLPDQSGEELVPMILAERPECRVILLTGQGDEASARRAQLCGAFDFLCKPCDANIIVARINEALRTAKRARARERKVTEIMIPIDSYTCVQASCTVKEGIESLKNASENFISSGLIMDSGHRAVLVFDGAELVGVLAMRNLIQAIRPSYLSGDGGGLPHSMRYSPMFWEGLFNARVRDIELRRVRDIMNPRPPVVDSETNLMHVAHLLCQENRRRVAVQRDGRIIGVVREQELFYELARLILQRDLVA